MYREQELWPLKLAAHRQIQSSAKITFDDQWSLVMINVNKSFDALVKAKHSFADDNEEVPLSELKMFLAVRN